MAPSGHSPEADERCNLPLPSVARTSMVCFPFGGLTQTYFQKAHICVGMGLLKICASVQVSPPSVEISTLRTPASIGDGPAGDDEILAADLRAVVRIVDHRLQLPLRRVRPALPFPVAEIFMVHEFDAREPLGHLHAVLARQENAQRKTVPRGSGSPFISQARKFSGRRMRSTVLPVL